MTIPQVIGKKKPGRPKQSDGLFHWQENSLGEFRVVLPDGQYLSIRKEDDKWAMYAKLKGNMYKGTRNTLEEAYHALDLMVWNNGREYWPKIMSKEINKHWIGNLDNLEEVYRSVAK